MFDGWSLLFRVIIYFLIIPVSVVLATPVILIAAVYGPENYFQNILEGYRKVFDFWIYLLQSNVL